MKKFSFTISGNKYDVELHDIEENIAQIEVNGSTYEVEIHKEIKTSKTPKLVRPQVFPTGESDKAKTAKPSERKGTGGIKAPLPGTILELKIKVGDTVKAGDVLLIMEAMKMENNIKADKPGTITDIKIKVGDSVLEGDLLVEIGS
ncbi:MAG: biotin/lipoyl-binding protein [Ignavibacteriae bacterium]|nr:biotin/lipoyl-binding protein [Ignavibacteriota bacterium]MCB9209482.1 biotin/lipoyl-binding protein [Ignavibacteriales bacterium]MCB9258125.1 biotin/lipoyl-binding protein [Ignavibacteriales bacterium]